MKCSPASSLLSRSEQKTDPRVALVEERVVRPLRAGRAERAQPARQHLAVGVGVVRRFVGRGGVLRQPDLRAELLAVAPRGALVAAGGEQDRGGTRQGAEGRVVQTDGVDEHAALARQQRLRARDVAADVAVADAPVSRGRGRPPRRPGRSLSVRSWLLLVMRRRRAVSGRGAGVDVAQDGRGLALRRRGRPRPAPPRPGRCPGSGPCGTGRGWRRGRPRSSPSGTASAG